MDKPKTCSFYRCDAEALEDGSRGLCDKHSEKETYTVKEAAGIWNASVRTVRHWINPQKIVAAERQGERTWLIPAEEFLKPHPTERPRSAESLRQAPVQEYSKPKRRVRWLAAIGIALTLLLIMVVVFATVAILKPWGTTEGGEDFYSNTRIEQKSKELKRRGFDLGVLVQGESQAPASPYGATSTVADFSFEGAQIYWNAGTGEAFEVHGAIAAVYGL